MGNKPQLAWFLLLSVAKVNLRDRLLLITVTSGVVLRICVCGPAEVRVRICDSATVSFPFVLTGR